MKKYILFFTTVILTTSFLFAQNEEKQSQLEKFQKDHPGNILVTWHQQAGGPKKIAGNNIYLKSRSINKMNVQAATEEFISKYQNLFNTCGTIMKLDRITELGNKYIVAYQQYYKNLPLWNVKLKLKVSANGQVLTIKSPCYSNLNISIEPKISIDKAKQIALTYLNADDEKSSINGELLLFPDDETNKIYLCWHIQATKKQKGVIIDAQSGQNIFEYDLYRNEEIRGTVQTKICSLPGQEGGTPNIYVNL